MRLTCPKKQGGNNVFHTPHTIHTAVSSNGHNWPILSAKLQQGAKILVSDR